MAKKDKGKSRKRIKNWKSRYDANGDAEGGIAGREKFSKRQIKLGDGRFAAGEEGLSDNVSTKSGTVTGVFRRGALVRVDGQDIHCGIAKTFRPPDGFENTSPLAIGDEVTIILPEASHVDGQLHLDKHRTDGMIVSRELRRTLLCRPESHRGRKKDDYQDVFVRVIASNIDQILLVAAIANPPVHRGLLDRFLIAAQRGELDLILAMNKIDLAEISDDIRTITSDMSQQGARILYYSALEGTNIQDVRNVLAGKKTVLAGASGVGKTETVNTLIEEVEARTRPVREKDQRGRHTTSQARVYDLPCGGTLIDTPGIRALGVDINPEELAWYFSDFQKLAPSCKFRDCTHTHEPGCRIIQAIETGEIPTRRYESYLRILETIE